MADYIENVGYVEKSFDGSWSGKYGHGYYAFVKEGLLHLGVERGREGGNLYVGQYKGEDTPFLKSIREENKELYNNIIEYYERYEDNFMKTKIIIELDNCRKCPYCKENRTLNAGYAFDYYCMKQRKIIAEYIEYAGEFPKEIPAWCPCRLEE